MPQEKKFPSGISSNWMLAQQIKASRDEEQRKSTALLPENLNKKPVKNGTSILEHWEKLVLEVLELSSKEVEK